MPTITAVQTSGLARDSSGKFVECISISNWRAKRVDVTATDWVLLDDGKPRSAIYIKNDGAVDVIIAPAATGNSNDPAQDTCGMSIPAGTAIEPAFGSTLAVYARTILGGGTCRLQVVESF